MVSYNNSNVLKFSVKDFKEQDAPNLIMNIQIYNSTHVSTYFACRTYTATTKKLYGKSGNLNGGTLILPSPSLKSATEILLTLDNIQVQICTQLLKN